MPVIDLDRKEAWTKEKNALAADLHRAQLDATVAEESQNVATRLAKTLQDRNSPNVPTGSLRK